jgi:hypothetical protein
VSTFITPSLRTIWRATRRLTPSLASFCVTVAALAMLGALTARPASAACGRSDCVGTHQISAILVVHDHHEDENVEPVEPDTGETWGLTATWNTLSGACPSCVQTATAGATVRVDWSDATGTWSATCTAGCNAFTGPIYGVTICDAASCGGGSSIDNSWEYELVVDLAKKNGASSFCGLPATDGYLSQVAYQTTSVDDGNIVDPLYCTEGAAVSPTSQTFSVTDSGVFECTFSCAAASGPSVELTYN